MGKRKHIGLTEKELSTSSGLLDDNNVEFTECRYEMFDYAGKRPPAPAFASKLVDLDDESVHEQRWTVGGTSEDWEIGEDGDTLIPLTKKAMKGVNVNSNFGQLIVSLINAGFDNDVLGEGRASGFDELKAHVIRVESKAGIKDEEGNKKKQEVIQVDKLLDEKAAKKSTKKATKPEKADEDADDDSLEAKTVKYVQEMLAKNDGELPKKNVAKDLYSDPDRDKKEVNGMVEFLFSDEWMSDSDRPWTLKSGLLKSK